MVLRRFSRAQDRDEAGIMTMADARPPTRSRWPQMTMFILALSIITPSLLGISLGQEYCDNKNYFCRDGYCCNTNNTCGNTTADCGANCLYQCTAGFMQCGSVYRDATCPDGMCCSIYGWCGGGDDWCSAQNCSSLCPTGNCQNGRQCPDGYCCNKDGYCGNTPGYCSAGSCKSQCPPPPAPSPSPTPSDARDGRKSGGSNDRKSGGNKVGILVGISTAIPAFLIACIVLALFLWKRHHGAGQIGWATMFTDDDPTLQLEGMPERFSYKQLSQATRDFSPESKLGQGGFGSVYRGALLSSGRPVAVKKINSDSSQGEKEFMAEVSIISQLRHRNLIQLQGWCKDAAKGKLLLVYELMPNGSLDKVLFEPSDSETACLSWLQRLNIVTGTAAAVDYLHQGWKQQVIHRDIKSSNIMLDRDWNAKLGDFGLARLVDHQRVAPTTIVAGTYGYIAPEAVTSGRFTERTDVFAFGAVVLEIACGRRAFSMKYPAEEIVLVDWVWQQLSEDALLSTVDKRLEGNYDTYLMEVMLIVGLLCSHPNPEARPSMRHVVEVLAGNVPVPSISASKPAPVFTSDSQDFFIKSLQVRTSGSTLDSRSGSTAMINMSR